VEIALCTQAVHDRGDGSRAGSFETELALGSSRVGFLDSTAFRSWLGLASFGSSFLLARLELDRVGSRPALHGVIRSQQNFSLRLLAYLNLWGVKEI
jgi:hypothetical protein